MDSPVNLAMDKASYIAVLTLALVFLLRYLLNGSSSKKAAGGRNLPPSPPAIPILGHLHLVEKPLHATLWRMAARLGPIFSLRLGSRRAVVVSSPELARACFTEHDVALADRPRFPSQLLVSFGGTALATACYGPRWRNLRRVAAVHLLSAHRVARMSSGVISAEVRAMARRLFRASANGSGGARVQLKRRLFELSLSVLMEAVAQTKATRPDADGGGDTDMSVEAQEFKKVVDEIVPHLGTANLWDYLPVLRWFDVFRVRNKIMRAVRRRDAFLGRLIEAERRRLEGGGDQGEEKTSMIAVLLTLQKTEPEVYTDTMITALCANLFGAGTETTSTTTEWAMSLLLNHPEVLKKAQAEMDAAVGTSRLVTADDVSHGLPYLQHIVSETLRLYPAAPMLLPHQASADCEIGGYAVPRGTMLLVNAYAIHRDPVAWGPAPEEFRPERFEEHACKGNEELLPLMLPFGMGRRKCPGETLALRTVGMVLATLVQCFDWERVGGVQVDMAQGSGITMPKAVPLEAVCRPRAAMLDVLQKL